MALFTINTTRQDTQFAYRIKYFPWAELSFAAKELIVWRQAFFLKKAQVQAKLSDDMTQLYHSGHVWQIVWAYNSIPTQQEWEGKSDTFHIHLDFRCSPAVSDFRYVVLDFRLASSHLKRVDL